MVAILSFLLTMSIAIAGSPRRMPGPRPSSIQSAIETHPDVLIVKLAENRSLTMKDGKVIGPGNLDSLNRLLQGAVPLIQRSPIWLRSQRKQIDPTESLADLSLYLRITGPDVVNRGNQLLADTHVETAYLAPKPAPPPSDIAPITPDFTELQTYREAGPDGFGFDIAHRWPGGDGSNVVIADIEYGFDHTHEDIEDREIFEIGYPMGWYPFHGNGVLGILGATDNGYGITGLAPEADLIMASPFVDDDIYNVAESIVLATEHLDAGDVLLIEQQGWVDSIFLPVEIDPAVFDAITIAVAKGIVVIEPTGNGACDLDPPAWDGWFDRSIRDSGAIIVGGGSSPTSGYTPRSWYPMGSCFGDRVDVQGWFDAIVTTSAQDGHPTYTDLFFPDGDGRQAYTSSFGGTSGAAPIIAAIAAVMNSVAWETRGLPWNPIELRAAMISTGTPQPDGEMQHIGPQPDLRRLLRIWGVR
jgi:serine protease